MPISSENCSYISFNNNLLLSYTSKAERESQDLWSRSLLKYIKAPKKILFFPSRYFSAFASSPSWEARKYLEVELIRRTRWPRLDVKRERLGADLFVSSLTYLIRLTLLVKLGFLKASSPLALIYVLVYPWRWGAFC